MFEYELKETAFYLLDNKIHSAAILSRMIIENSKQDSCVTEQWNHLCMFGESKLNYSTIHGVFDASQIFKSK